MRFDQEFVYFIGGPADLSKQAMPLGQVPPSFTIIALPAGYVTAPESGEIKYETHTYVVRQIAPYTHLAIHPDVYR